MIKMLDDLDKKLINQLVYTTKKNIDIYTELNIPESTFYNHYCKPEFKEELNKQLADSLALEAVQAKKVLVDLLNSENESIRLKTAIELLNKAGFKEPQKIEADVNTDINIVIGE